jgi:hypothetical protein
MKYHALIAKFIGIWPSERSLVGWIDKYWKPKGGFDLRLGAKGLFTIIFYHVEDRNRIFKGGPYFYNSTGLFYNSTGFQHDWISCIGILVSTTFFSILVNGAPMAPFNAMRGFWHPLSSLLCWRKG